MTTASDDRAVADRLEGERRRIQAEIDDIIAAGSLSDQSEQGRDRELSGADQHDADEATDVQYREQDIAQVESLRAELADVDAAAARLAEGTYGRCVVCGKEIGAERLDALPATPYC